VRVCAQQVGASCGGERKRLSKGQSTGRSMGGAWAAPPMGGPSALLGGIEADAQPWGEWVSGVAASQPVG
jgi:hypothetical protein